MESRIRMTSAMVKILEVFLDEPGTERYGLDVMRAADLPSGTTYPILMRLRRAGWLEAHWEEIDPAVAGRPARRWYRLTATGASTARAELAAVRQQRPAAPPATSRPTWAS